MSRAFALLVLVPAACLYLAFALAVTQLASYGLTLMVGAPLTVGAYIGAVRARTGRTRNVRGGLGQFTQAALLVAVLLLLTGNEGLICLVMALPLQLALGLVGVLLGVGVAGQGAAPASTSRAVALPLVALLAASPLAHLVERGLAPPAPVREVTTAVLVDAPLERVWEQVVAFSRIEEPPDWLSRLGVAYPLEARIEGAGVGAVRHCVFSTGAFVEPITRWEPPHLLAFDVERCPPPVRELSFREVHAPHLTDHFVSHRGQFRLSQQADGRVLLEGTTWYSHAIAPDWYWGPLSDALIHRIHRRVLRHITRTSE